MKVKLSKKQLGVVIAVVLLCCLLLAGSITCIIRDETPAQLFMDIFTNQEEAIVGKWQRTDKEIEGYEFTKDGTYKYYFASLPLTNANYQVVGNKLILRNSELKKEYIYKIEFKDDDNIKLTKIEEDGEKVDEQISTYKRVNQINLKTPLEIANELKNEKARESQTTTGE